MNEQSQDWTPEYVQGLIARGLSYVINAHNAALAAEREKMKHEVSSKVALRQQLESELEIAEKQLANELGKRLAAETIRLSEWVPVTDYDTVRQQLADEREKFRKAKEWNQIAELELRNSRSLYNELIDDFKKVSEQLLQAQVAIADHDEDFQNGLVDCYPIKDALAKVKEDK